jgi:urea transport system permease protein
MVIFAAVGGRMSLVGAVYGTLLVNAGKTFFSESFPDLWLFLMAALFIGVTMAFPMGLAGLWEERIVPWWKSRRAALREAAAVQSQAPVTPKKPASSSTPASVQLPDGASGQSV